MEVHSLLGSGRPKCQQGGERRAAALPAAAERQSAGGGPQSQSDTTSGAAEAEPFRRLDSTASSLGHRDRRCDQGAGRDAARALRQHPEVEGAGRGWCAEVLRPSVGLAVAGRCDQTRRRDCRITCRPRERCPGHRSRCGTSSTTPLSKSMSLIRSFGKGTDSRGEELFIARMRFSSACARCTGTWD